MIRFSFSVLLAALTSLSVVTAAFGRDAFPQGPNPVLTPGALCQGGRTFRYPERIPYCDRKVDKKTKDDVIKEYDEELGYSVRSMPRGEFKIDHFIPLCAGGSNTPDNLWPQHQSVYAYTDALEPLICEKMAQGRLRQAEAVQLIREAKIDLSKVDAIVIQLQSL